MDTPWTLDGLYGYSVYILWTLLLFVHRPAVARPKNVKLPCEPLWTTCANGRMERKITYTSGVTEQRAHVPANFDSGYCFIFLGLAV